MGGRGRGRRGRGGGGGGGSGCDGGRGRSGSGSWSSRVETRRDGYKSRGGQGGRERRERGGRQEEEEYGRGDGMERYERVLVRNRRSASFEDGGGYSRRLEDDGGGGSHMEYRGLSPQSPRGYIRDRKRRLPSLECGWGEYGRDLDDRGGSPLGYRHLSPQFQREFIRNQGSWSLKRGGYERHVDDRDRSPSMMYKCSSPGEREPSQRVLVPRSPISYIKRRHFDRHMDERVSSRSSPMRYQRMSPEVLERSQRFSTRTQHDPPLERGDYYTRHVDEWDSSQISPSGYRRLSPNDIERTHRVLDRIQQIPPQEGRDYPLHLDSRASSRSSSLRYQRVGPDELQRSQRIVERNQPNHPLERRDEHLADHVDYQTSHFEYQRMSPDGLGGSERAVVRTQENPPMERKEYSLHLDEGVGSQSSLSGNQHMSSDALKRSQKVFTRNQNPPSRRNKYSSHLEDHSGSLISPTEYQRIETKRQYEMQESANLNPSLMHESSSSRIAQDTHFPATGSSSRIDTLVPNSLQAGGTVQHFKSLPPNIFPIQPPGSQLLGKSVVTFSTGNVNMNPYKDDIFQTRLRESYKEEENLTVPSRDILYPARHVPQPKVLGNLIEPLTEKSHNFYREGRPVAPELLVRGIGKFVDTVSGIVYNKTSMYESSRESKDVSTDQRELHSSSRVAHQDYSSSSIEKKDVEYPSVEVYENVQPNMARTYANNDLSRPGYQDHSIKMESSHASRGRHYSLQGDHISCYDGKKGTASERKMEYMSTGSKYEFSADTFRGRSNISPMGNSGLEKGVCPVFFNDPVLEYDRNTEMLFARPQRRLEVEDGEICSQGNTPAKTKYLMNDEMSNYNTRRMLSSSRDNFSDGSNERNNFRRTQELTGDDEHWDDENFDGVQHSLEMLKYGRVQYGKERSNSISHRLSGIQESSLNEQMVGTEAYYDGGESSDRVRTKKRLRSPCKDSPNNKKFRKRIMDDRIGSMDSPYSDNSENQVAVLKDDPSTNCDEFKLLVRRAFFKYCKQLNENPALLKRFKEEGKSGALLCSVCGRDSKEFVTTRSLAHHACTTSRQKAAHLGLHRALCILMGWTSVTDYGSPWTGQVVPDIEAFALKEDLILWPPLVIVHNVSVGNKNPDERKVTMHEEMISSLKCLGFSPAQVCHGKSADQSIMVVKFLPIFPGIQEAERLSKYYTENKRGRAEFQLIKPEGGTIGETVADKLEDVLFGYIGIAEDLVKLDFETKKRCVVKSMKEIKAIANAPLTTA